MGESAGSGKGRRQLGQGMTEYIIIVALIAIGTIAVVSIFGDNIRALFGSAAQALAGKGDAQIEGRQDVGELGKSLGDFAEGTTVEDP